ncbi:MAG TPA: hypothetical protein VEL76_27345 [Gemmataceae bacterium]|nr:hypothetical protein [Gemmataceae bacterium]
MALELTSTAFQEGATIPERYTGDGRNVSPPAPVAERTGRHPHPGSDL